MKDGGGQRCHGKSATVISVTDVVCQSTTAASVSHGPDARRPPAIDARKSRFAAACATPPATVSGAVFALRVSDSEAASCSARWARPPARASPPLRSHHSTRRIVMFRMMVPFAAAAYLLAVKPATFRRAEQTSVAHDNSEARYEESREHQRVGGRAQRPARYRRQDRRAHRQCGRRTDRSEDRRAMNVRGVGEELSQS